ncbi:8915_t:CDS:2 [Funneliformis mosseae]|uniref:8915_t:CDS:1 n=1 Tax=Funneliformis mosseae TaxID=27381 RepID=A0A9N8VDL5_FUNMO|nr:8915_t:CDS:2 [Funneliformis mosseae]
MHLKTLLTIYLGTTYLAKSLPRVSPFFINYVVLQVFRRQHSTTYGLWTRISTYYAVYSINHPYESSGLSWPKILPKNYGWRIYFSTINDWIYVIEEIISFCCNNRAPFCYYGCLLLSFRFDVKSRPSSQGSGKKVAVVDAPIGSSANTSSNLNENNNNELVRDVLEDDLYRAEPYLYTDYIQPSMTQYNGVLHTGMRNYISPSLVGVYHSYGFRLKGQNKDNENTYGGFIRRLLGMNKKFHNRNKLITTDARMNAAIEDAGNGTGAELPGSLSGHGADDFIEQIMEESEQMITSSEKPSTST